MVIIVGLPPAAAAHTYAPPVLPQRSHSVVLAPPRRRPSARFSSSCAATPHRRLPPAIQEASLRPGAKGGHGGGGCRRRAAVGPRGPRAGWNLTSREAREQARSADFGRWGGSPATSRGSSSRSDFGECGGARRDGVRYGPNRPPPIFLTTAIEVELDLWEEEIGTSMPLPPASSPSVGAASATPAQAGRCFPCSWRGGVEGSRTGKGRKRASLVWPGSPMESSSA